MFSVVFLGPAMVELYARREGVLGAFSTPFLSTYAHVAPPDRHARALANGGATPVCERLSDRFKQVCVLSELLPMPWEG